jgi:hypothetical protein
MENTQSLIMISDGLQNGSDGYAEGALRVHQATIDSEK